MLFLFHVVSLFVSKEVHLPWTGVLPHYACFVVILLQQRLFCNTVRVFNFCSGNCSANLTFSMAGIVGRRDEQPLGSLLLLLLFTPHVGAHALRRKGKKKKKNLGSLGLSRFVVIYKSRPRKPAFTGSDKLGRSSDFVSLLGVLCVLRRPRVLNCWCHLGAASEDDVFCKNL